MPICKKWIFSKKKRVDEDSFELNEEHCQDIRKGEIMCRALFLSVDPITRLYLDFGINDCDVIPGRQIARVVESRHPKFPKGKLICGPLGWQTYSIVSLEEEGLSQKIQNLPKHLETTGLPKSACLGVLGVPGIIAYSSLVNVCQIKKGDTVVISSAAGQIGHIAGQIAKIFGCSVIGYVGTGDKASLIKTELGFDWAFNYQTQNVCQTLKIAAPNGVDVFIDSVGGIFFQHVINRMARNGRICLLGNLARYNHKRRTPEDDDEEEEEQALGSRMLDMDIALKNLKISGFSLLEHVYDKDCEEILEKLSGWCKDGSLTPIEHVVEGFENMPKVLFDQLSGKFQGKLIVRV